MYVLAGVIFVIGYGLLIGLGSLCDLIKALMEVMKEQTLAIGKQKKKLPALQQIITMLRLVIKLKMEFHKLHVAQLRSSY